MRGSAWPRYRYRAGIPAHVAACWTNAIGSGAVVPATRNRRTGPLRGLLGGRVEAKTGAVRGDSGAKHRRHNEPILRKAPETLWKSATGWLTEHPVIGPWQGSGPRGLGCRAVVVLIVLVALPFFNLGGAWHRPVARLVDETSRRLRYRPGARAFSAAFFLAERARLHVAFFRHI